MADRLYTSAESDEILSAIRFATKMEKYILARLAFSLSLATDGVDVPRSTNVSGGEMKRPTFIGSDELFIKTILSYVYKTPEIDEDELYSNKSLVKDHVDNGCKYLEKLFEECGHSSELLLKKVAAKVEFSGRREIQGSGLEIYAGKGVLDKKDVVIELNNTTKHANSHLAIMGKPGVGKTQFLLKILTDIRIKSNYQTNFIFFDYKGDVVDNEKFLGTSKVQAYRLLQGNQTLPINPFVLPDYSEQTINVSAREKAESFASINSKLGVVQKGALTEAIRAAYAKRANTATPYPDFNDVLDIATQMYEEENKKDDSLIEVLKDLADFNLFWKHGSENEPIEKLTNRTLLIDVHAMPVLKELVGYLVIERLYKEMASLPDSPVENGKRTLRTILVIDEAHNYLGQKNIFLQRIIREGRSKGIVVFFASQSPNDYQQKFFNFQELLEFAYIFQCEGSIIRGSGCSCCCKSPQQVVVGINSIVDTDEWMIPYFQGGYDEAKLYTRKSSKKIKPICPDCHQIKSIEIPIYSICNNKSIGCNCGDGQSYPNKLMFSILKDLQIYFETEYSPVWIKPLRYDFYFKLNNNKYIVEMDGGWHKKQ